MDILQKTKEHLSSCNTAEIMDLSEKSGIPFHTILKIKSGETKNPGVLTVQPILKAIKEAE